MYYILSNLLLKHIKVLRLHLFIHNLFPQILGSSQKDDLAFKNSLKVTTVKIGALVLTNK